MNLFLEIGALGSIVSLLGAFLFNRFRTAPKDSNMNRFTESPIAINAARFTIFLLSVITIGGCGSNVESRFADKLDAVESVAAYQKGSSNDHALANMQSSGENGLPTSNLPASIGGADPSSDNAAAKRTTVRRIIYTSSLTLVVKKYSEFEAGLPRLVDSVGGFVSKSETDRRYNDRQSGTWVIRVPVDRYNDLQNGMSALGFAESRREDAQDVSAEYVDVEARIRNNRKLEERIITMLAERTGKLSDVLEIERELARVREEVERMEGRLRVLADRTTLATVTVREEQEYIPAAAPTFNDRLGNALGGSLSSLRRLAESGLVLLVAMLPWAVVLGIVAGIVGVIVRRSWPRNASAT